MPLARYTLYTQGEQVHASVWPGMTDTRLVLSVNRPPVINAIYANPVVLRPPNHKARDVTIVVDATDPDGPDGIVRITCSAADEYGIYDDIIVINHIIFFFISLLPRKPGL